MRLLIVSYTYPPSKSVNGFRPYYFGKALVHEGYEVHVLTRHFTGEEKFREYQEKNHTPFSMSLEEGVIVFRTPFENTWFKYDKIEWIRKSGLWKFIYLIQLALGRTTQESYNKWFRPYLNKLLKEKKYNLIIAESGPTNLARTVSREARRVKTPYVIDFRDVFYHEMLKMGQLSFKKSVKVSLEKWYMKNCIGDALHIFGESAPKLIALGLSSSKSTVINNGYDEMVWASGTVVKNENRFIILIAGTLYDHPFLNPLLQSLRLFAAYNFSNVIIRFIAPGSPEIIRKINYVFEGLEIEIIPNRLTYSESVEQLKRAQVVAYHGWKGYKGIYSSKIYDYIRSGKKILIVPSDNDVIDALVHETQSGIATDEPQRAADQLYEWYSTWVSDGELVQSSDKNLIQKYSRQAQNKMFVNKISSLLSFPLPISR